MACLIYSITECSRLFQDNLRRCIIGRQHIPESLGVRKVTGDCSLPRLLGPMLCTSVRPKRYPAKGWSDHHPTPTSFAGGTGLFVPGAGRSHEDGGDGHRSGETRRKVRRRRGDGSASVHYGTRPKNRSRSMGQERRHGDEADPRVSRSTRLFSGGHGPVVRCEIHMLLRPHRRLGAISCLDLPQDALEVDFDRGFSHSKLSRNVLV